MPICAKTLAAACLLAASAHGLALLPKCPSASRAPLTRRAYSSTTDYHAEGDESGPAQLSGSWQLETVDEYGTATSATVVLRHDGLFHTAPQPDGEEFTGKWSLSDESELTLARFGRFHSVESYYIGQMRTAQTVDGYVGTGAMDSAWEGTFKMHLIVADERAPVVVEPKLRQYDAAELGGRWRLDSRLFGGVPNFLSLEFDAATREFVVTDGLGEKGHISGNWNVFKDTMRFNEGSGGSGRRFWLTMARFGMLGGEVSRCWRQRHRHPPTHPPTPL